MKTTTSSPQHRSASDRSRRWRVGPFRAGTFRSPLHDERLAAHLGAALGLTFSICFLTGLISHAVQAKPPPSWFTWPSRPINLYRITQGTHVLTGIASIPLLLAKLWVVYHKLWSWPLVRNTAHAVERLFLFPLIGGSLFLLVTGVINIAYWYDALPFSFPAAHMWASWVTIGALIVHVAAKSTATADAFTRRPTPLAAPPDGAGFSRRGFLTAVAAASAALVASVAGQTVAPLRRLAVLAPRNPTTGPQGIPVNKSAAEAKVAEAAMNPAYRLVVSGKIPTSISFSRADLAAMPQHEAGLPIICVEGWSASGQWRGPRVRDLLELVGAESGAEVRIESLQQGGPYRTSLLNRLQSDDPDTLLALELNGEPLHIDHGYPVRLIGPNRAGVTQTKWISGLVVL